MSENGSVNNGKLFGRIAAVMAAVRKLPEDGYNKHDQYKYTTAATAVEHIGRAMAENGLVIMPVIVHEATGKPDNDKAFYSTVEVDFHVCDVDGHSFVSRWVGQGVNYRTPDKALKTALTNANTTFLLKLFQVGAGEDDPELDSEVEPQRPAQRAVPRPQPLSPLRSPRLRGEGAEPQSTGPVLTTDIQREQSTGLGRNDNGHQPAQEPAQQPAANGVWSAMGDYTAAKQWATDSGKFGHTKHVDAAWSKLFSQHEAHKAENAAKFLAAWREYVENHEPAPPRVGGDSAGVNSEKAATNGQPERIAA